MNKKRLFYYLIVVVLISADLITNGLNITISTVSYQMSAWGLILLAEREGDK